LDHLGDNQEFGKQQQLLGYRLQFLNILTINQLELIHTNHHQEDQRLGFYEQAFWQWHWIDIIFFRLVTRG
jgi:hypothetical protein